MTNISKTVSDRALEQPGVRAIASKNGENGQSIPGRFERHVCEHPNQTAFKTKNVALSWDALNQQANRVARAVLSRSKGEQKPVALFLDQGAAVLTAIIGVLKAGKFYVPLDPAHPVDRNRYVLTDTEANLVVTNNRMSMLATELARSECDFLNIDTLDSSISSDNLGVRISPDALVNVVYTSGSTGEPKGVVHTHRTVIQRAMRGKHLQICADDRITAVGSAGRDIFTTLVNSAGSFPWNVKEEGLTNLADWLAHEEITIYRSVPSVFRQFVKTLTDKEKFPKLRVIMLTGEPLYRKDADLYKRHFSPDCLLVNSLSATETGAFRQFVIDKETTIPSDTVPAGYAVQDKEVILLDDNGERVESGEIGEIAVRSRYLSPGYWRRPDLTEAKFLPDPAGGDKRIYLTGDLGRMLPDGCLEHHGRKDFQVKIRGHRIEVTEVEEVLRKMTIIQEVVVVPREDEPGDKFLVAYIVPERNVAVDISQVRRFVQKKLPAFMVPSRFVILTALPHTPNGKVDRLALPAPSSARPELDCPFVAPRTPVEKELAQIWAEVLSLDEIGIHDNFFDLGGNSLLATQVISRVINAFKVELPIKSLFESPTVADMAVVIAQHQAGKEESEEMTRMLADIESLTEEEAKHLLEQEMREKDA